MSAKSLREQKNFWEKHPHFDRILAVVMIVVAIAVSAFILTKGFT